VEEYEKRLQSILADIASLNLLSNNLLELAQVSIGTANRPLREVQIDEVIYQAALALNSKHPDYHVSFEFEELPAEDEQGFIVTGDESLLTSAFLNLMENACKFSPDKSVKVVLGTEQEYLTLQFIDKGIGIADTELDHIFQPFYRGANAKQIRGHGIGLSLTHRIIDLHHGFIGVTSVLQQGTTFSVKLSRQS
jgi:signal transduction histidine kinase